MYAEVQNRITKATIGNVLQGGEGVYRRSKVALRRPKKPEERELPSLPAELMESLREDSGLDEVQLPAPPRPTCHTAPSFIFRSRVFWRSSSSSKEKIGRSLLWWIFPAPPRPELNLDDDDDDRSPVSK